MSNIVARVFEETPVRTVERDGEVWWVLVDVCRVLGLGNPSQIAATRLDDDEKNTIIINEGIRGNPNVVIVSEAGLYAVIQQSRKPIARRFDRWVRHQVLPSIRRTGNYIGNPAANAPMHEVRAAVESVLAPVQEAITDQGRKIDECLTEQHITRDAVVRLEKQLDDQRRNTRRYFTPAQKRTFYSFALFEGRRCPVLRDTFIVDADGSPMDETLIHHAVQVGIANLQTGIFMSEQAHRKVHSGEITAQDFMLIFHEYQRRLALFVNAQTPLPFAPTAMAAPRYADGTPLVRHDPQRQPQSATRKRPKSQRNLSLTDMEKAWGVRA